MCKPFENEEDSKEGGSCGHEEEEDGEDDGAKEELLHGAVSAVHSVSQRIIFLTEEQPPQSNQS